MAHVSWRLVVVAAALATFLALGAYQLDLPGLQYDEAKEAGLNAMQLVTGQPVTAFRDAVLQIGSWRIPLMVQDYIGALNVLLAVPFLRLGGVTVVALRWLPLLTAALTLWLAWRLASSLGGAVAGGATAILLALNPSFIFWSRQGIFVTNLTALLFLASLLAAVAWWRRGQPAALWAVAFCWGLGIYAKLLFVWAIGAMLGVALLWWLLGSRPSVFRSGSELTPRGRKASLVWVIALALLVLPLMPLILFNLQTGGTVASLFGNLGRSYYGVDNHAYWPNLLTRLSQFRILMSGDHLWYLGEVYANRWAPWLATGLVLVATVLALVRRTPRPAFLIPVALLAFMVAQSAFTVSDLFITHYALLLPLIALAGGLAFAAIWDAAQDLGSPARRLLPAVACLALLLWAGIDAANSVQYHQVLASSGGYGSHSDAIYRLADYLAQYEPSAPLALDWGMDAQLRFLSRGQVNPVEVFGYSLIDRPDAGFAGRIEPFLANPDTLYIAHVPAETVFHGRVEALRALAEQHHLQLREEAHFDLRSGKALFVVYRAVAG